MTTTLAMLLLLAGCGEYSTPPPPRPDAPREFPIVTSDFAISATPATVSLATPGTAVVDIAVHRTGPHATVTLVAASLPPNVVATFDHATVEPAVDSAQLTLTVGAPTSGAVRVDGTGFTQHGEAVGEATRTATVMVTGTN